jgi:murein DD-endopeptidase MepM/ murein hydrolase activator NlpD
MSGYAMGDHLHFGILVQGIEVRPEEWMDRKWIADNITSVIDTAKMYIDQQ